MKNDNTCCQTGDCDTAVAESNPTTVNFTEPSWNADRHDRGVDLQVILPGVAKDDLQLEVRGQQLHLEATRRAPENRGRLIYGRPAPESYRLRLRLGDTLDGSGLRAKLTDGILEVSVPLVESAQKRKVEIN